MKTMKLRYPLPIIALMAATLPIHAQQPAASPPASAPPPAPAPAQNARPPANPAASQAAASPAAAQLSSETLKKAKELGLKAETHNGTTKYCWEDASVGTRFTTKKCVGPDQLDDIIAQREAVKRDMEQRALTGGSTR